MSNAKAFWDAASEDPDVRYKYIADDWAKTEDFLELINSTNNKWNNVMEIGCGIGRLIVPLADQYSDCNFYGIDISEKMMALAPKRNNINYGAIEENLDLVYSMLVFQHIEHQDKINYMQLAYDKLVNEGTLFFQFVVGEENAPYSYQTNNEEIQNQLEKIGFKDIKFSQHIHHQWSFVIAKKGIK